jgi:hypothetical protein
MSLPGNPRLEDDLCVTSGNAITVSAWAAL